MNQACTIKSLVSLLMVGNLVVASWGQPAPSRLVRAPAEAVAARAAATDVPPSMPKALTLPATPIVPAASVGYLSGASSVTPTGEYTYSIPITVAPGRAGMQPALSLEYSSGGGNGLLGFGWSLSGIPAINRCASSLAVEGYTRGVQFDGGDRFCLNGAKLVAITGTYGATGTEYRTEAESFAKIVSGPADETGPESFTVYAKNGRILKFVGAQAKRVAAIDPESGAAGHDAVVRAVWLLWSEEDRSGNTIAYEYYRSPAPFPVIGDYTVESFPLEYYPTKIVYTSHPGAGANPAMAAKREVRFQYEDRQDPQYDVLRAWTAGVLSQTTKRLRSIEIWAPNPLNTQLVWQYDLTYQPKQGPDQAPTRSRLVSVRQCAAGADGTPKAGGCAWAKTFTWNTVAEMPTFATSYPDVPAPLNYYTASDKIFTEGESPAVQVLDLNGDGASDVLWAAGELDLWAEYTAQSNGWVLGGQYRGKPHTAWLSKRKADGRITPLVDQRALDRQQPIATANYGHVRLPESLPVDLDGNGRDELWAAIDNSLDLDAKPYGPTPKCLWRQMHWDNATGFVKDKDFDCVAVAYHTAANGTTVVPITRRQNVTFADGNGDALPDLFHEYNARGWILPDPEENPDGVPYYAYDPKWRVASNKYQGIPGTLAYPGQGTPEPVAAGVIMDTNGDGKADINSAVPAPAVSASRHFGDFNGDGLPDMLMVEEDATPTGRVYWNNGRGFYKSGGVIQPSVDRHPDHLKNVKTRFADRGIRIADVNGDGRADVVVFRTTWLASGASQIDFFLSRGMDGFARYDRVVAGKGTRIDAKFWLDEEQRPYTERVVLNWGELFSWGFAAAITLLAQSGHPVLPIEVIDGEPLGPAAPEILYDIVRDYADDSQVPGLARGWSLSQLGDFDGDGAVDILRHINGEWPGEGQFQILKQAFQPRDLVVAVQDEKTLWDHEVITYSPEWSDTPARKLDFDCVYPLHCLRKGLVVVRAVTSFAHLVNPAIPTVGGRTLYYAYEDPVTDMHGRGFLGFGMVKIWDPAQPRETITTFNHRTSVDGKYYPGAGWPATVTTVVPLLSDDAVPTHPPSARARITQSVHQEPDLRLLNDDKTFVVLPRGTTTKEWEELVSIDWTTYHTLNDAHRHIYDYQVPPHPARSTFVYRAFDSYGNQLVEEVQATAADGSTGVLHRTLTGFENRPADWLIGLPDKTYISSTRAGGVGEVTRTVEYTYNTVGQLESIQVEPQGDTSLQSTTSLVYNPYGLLTQTTTAVANAAPRTTHLAYDPVYCSSQPPEAVCAPDEKVFASQRWSDYTIAAYRPSVWTATHPAYGVPVVTMDHNGVHTVMTYDGLGRPLTVKRDGEQPVSFTYEARQDAYHKNGVPALNGLKTTVTVGQQVRQAITDGRGLTLQTAQTGFNGDLIKSDAFYDMHGRLKLATNAYETTSSGWTRYTYDSLDRVQTVVYPDETRMRHTYPSLFETHTFTPGNVAGNLIAENHHYVVTDVDGRLIQTINLLPSAAGTTAQAITTTYTYAPFDLVEEVCDDGGHTTHFEYDRLGRRTTVTEPDRGTTTTTYNGFGQMVTATHQATNETHVYSYDALGRVTSKDTPDGRTEFQWDINPHGVGQLAWAATGVNAQGVPRIVTYYDYDSFGRVNQHSMEDFTDLDAHGYPRYYRNNLTYDDYGRVDTVAYPDVPGRERFTITHSYNPFGFLYKIRDLTTGQALWTADVRNLDLGLTQDTLGNGVTVWQNREPLRGRVVHKAAALGTTVLQSVDYAYHRNGLVQSRTATDHTGLMRVEHFHYDALQRLTQWDLQSRTVPTAPMPPMTATGYTYDTLGNLTEVYRGSPGVTNPFQPGFVVEHNTYGQPDGRQPHALTASSVSGAYTYDPKGRQTQGGGRTNIVYTGFDLPQTLTKEGRTWTFTYDAFGQRVKKSGPEGTTVYFPGLFERRIVGAQVTDVFHVGTVAQVSYLEPVRPGTSGSTMVRYPLTDQLGSTSLVTLADGTVDRSAQYFFEPFGRRINADGTPFLGRVGPVTSGFAGHEHEDALGWINMQGRLYDPVIKRFLSADPIVAAPLFSQAWNPYSYVWNSPLNLTDPSGFLPCGAWVQWGGGPWTWQPHPQDWCGSGGTSSTSTSWAEAGARANGAPFYGSVSQGIGGPKPVRSQNGSGEGPSATMAWRLPYAVRQILAETHYNVNAMTDQPMRGPLVLWSGAGKGAAATLAEQKNGYLVGYTTRAVTAYVDVQYGTPYGQAWSGAARDVTRNAVLHGDAVYGGIGLDTVADPADTIQMRIEQPTVARWGSFVAGLGVASGGVTIYAAATDRTFGSAQPLFSTLGIVGGSLEVGGSLVYGYGALTSTGSAMTVGSAVAGSGAVVSTVGFGIPVAAGTSLTATKGVVSNMTSAPCGCQSANPFGRFRDWIYAAFNGMRMAGP